MARIGVAGFLHETNTFAESRARFVNFVEADAWPGLLWGAEMFDSIRGVNIPVAGFVEAAQQADYALVPLVWASANPSGPVTEDAFECYWWLLSRSLDEAGPLDALFLDLHGAMVTEHLMDGEGELLRRLRAKLGRDLPILATLDFHANVSKDMVKLSDALLVYRTYPHVDMSETGARAVALLPRLLAGERFARSFRTLPYLIPMPWQSTLADPMVRLVRLSDALESQGCVAASFVPGFPLADVPDCAPSVLVYATDQAVADAATEQLYQAALSVRREFAGKLWTATEAVQYAQQHRKPGRPVILADTQDNPGGGGHSDSTDLIHALLSQRVEGAVVGLLCDPVAAAAAHAAGVGATLDLGIGARITQDGGPSVPGPWRVEQLGDGRFMGTGPFYAGCHMDLGPMARLSKDGVTVLVSSRKQQAADQAMFRHLGVEPVECPVLVLKSSVHFRADFGPLTDTILVVAAAGPNVADLHQLTYRHCKLPPA